MQLYDNYIQVSVSSILKSILKSGDIMPPYKDMYLTLFHSVTNAIHMLQSAQQQTEDMFVEEATPQIKIIKIQPDAQKDSED